MIGSLLDKLFVAVGADLTEFSEAMGQAGDDAAKASTEIIKSLDDAGQKGGIALSKIADVAKTAVSAVGPIVTDALSTAAGDGIAAMGEKLGEGDIWGALSDGAAAAGKSAFEEIATGLADVLLPQLIEAAVSSTAFTTAMTGVKTAMLSTIPIIQSVGSAFMTLMLSPLGLIVAAVAAVVAAWYYWDDIKAVIDDVGSAISDWWSTNLKPTFDQVMAIVKQVADIFMTYFSAQIEAAVSFVKALLAGDFQGAWEAAKSFVMNAIKAILSVIAMIAPNALTAVKTLVSNFSTWLGDLAGKMLTFGREIINGLVRGILAAPQAVWNALKSIVMSGVNGVRDFLGIRSPSRLFMEIGGFVTEGLAIGINAGASAVKSAMDNLARVVTTGFDPALKKLAQDVSSMMDRLFPDAAQRRKLEKDYADLDAALAKKLISPEAWKAAKDRLDAEADDMAKRAQDAAQRLADNTPEAKLTKSASAIIDQLLPNQAEVKALQDKIIIIDQAMSESLIDPDLWREARARLQKELDALVEQMAKAGEAANDNLAEPIDEAAQHVAESINEMVDQISSALSGLKQAIDDGDIIGIIEGVSDTIVSVVSAYNKANGGSGSDTQGRATGGNVGAYGTFIVGENGPEVLRMGAQGGRVYNSTDTQKMLSGGGNDGSVQVGIAVEASEYFDARVTKVTKPGMQNAIQQGAMSGHTITVNENRRNASRRMPG